MVNLIRRIGQHAVIYCNARQDALDAALLQTLGEHRFDLDTLTQEISFSSDRGQVRGKAELVASIAVSPATMVWGWSPLLEGVGGTNAATKHIRTVGESQGLACLTTEEIGYPIDPNLGQDEAIITLAHDLGMLAVELCGPQTLYYLVPTGGGGRIVVLISSLSIELAPITLDQALISLPQLVGVGLIDDIEWSLSGLARLCGWGFNAASTDTGARSFTLTDQSGAFKTVIASLDEYGRMTNLSMTLG